MFCVALPVLAFSYITIYCSAITRRSELVIQVVVKIMKNKTGSRFARVYLYICFCVGP